MTDLLLRIADGGAGDEKWITFGKDRRLRSGSRCDFVT